MANGAIDSNDIHLDAKDRSVDQLLEEIRSLQKQKKHANRFALGLSVLALILLAAIVAILIHFSSDKDVSSLHTCGTGSGGQRGSGDVLDEPENPGPFHDLTVPEIKRVRRFLEETIGVVKPEEAKLSDAHIYMMDLEPPKKADALQFLDNNGLQPPRYARVTLFRGDLNPPVVHELICGPLDQVTNCTVVVEVLFSQRPIEFREYSFYTALIKSAQLLFGHIIRESYGAALSSCEDACLNYFNFPVALGRYGNDTKRRTWILLDYHIPYMSLHPLDMGFLCDVDGVNETNFVIEKVWYSGTLYSSPQELIDAYNNGTAKKTKRTYPTEEESVFSTFRQRGPPKPSYFRRPPELIEPDGKRYTIRHRKVEYLDMWSFYYRMSTIYGPALYDIQFLGERIAYEISLNELVVFYSGFNPMQRQSFYVDTSALQGSRSKALVAGADCPTTATFLPFTVTSQGREEPAVFPRAICVFEQNLGSPLRRHHSYSLDDGAEFGGMLDSALIVRSIHTVDNYDYVIDFTFHQNGAMGVSVGQTGFISASDYSPEERPYGFRLRDYLYGGLHMHAAHFKVDVDVSGTSNRYETLDIEEETVFLRQALRSEYTQTKFTTKLKQTEKEAAYEYSFNHPMYHVFHNNATRNKFGEKKSYRLSSGGFAKQLLRKDIGDEITQPWARYQLVVTKQKDSEQTSSASYSQWGGKRVVDFEKYMEDNEDIVDEDLVAWVTMGVHHIPHAEDLPVTSTSGKHQSFHLFPYNYFTECPSVMSRDAIRITHADSEAPEKGLLFDYHGTGDVSQTVYGGACHFKPLDTSEAWKQDPDSLFETTGHKGLI